jgi:hypothetical protein
MNSNKKNISFVITHMKVPVSNQAFRNSRNQPQFEKIDTRGINIITITKLLTPLDTSIANTIKEKILDMYKRNVYISIIFNNNGIPILIKERMPMILFINYLTNPHTNDAKKRSPTNNLEEFIHKKLIYRSKKIIFRINDENSNRNYLVKNLFYDIHHHPKVIFNHILFDESKVGTQQQQDIIGKYYLGGSRLTLPKGVDGEFNLNNLLDSYGNTLPDCIILIGCRTLIRTNINPRSLHIGSLRTFAGSKYRSDSTNQFPSDPSNGNLGFGPFYRSQSDNLHNSQYNQNINKINSFEQNNNNITNQSELETFKIIYLQNNPNASNKNINTAYRNFMNTNLSLQMNITNANANANANSNVNAPNDIELNTFINKYLKNHPNATKTNAKTAYKKFMRKSLSLLMNFTNSNKNIENENNNKITPNELELKTFTTKYLKTHPNANGKTINKEFKKFMKKRLSFAISI